MITPYEIPLTPMPQLFSIALNNIQYTILLQWCDPANCWKIDIQDVNGVNILAGIPLVTGVDLLQPYKYLNFGGSLVAQTDHDINAIPTYDNLGVTSHLLWITTP